MKIAPLGRQGQGTCRTRKKRNAELLFQPLNAFADRRRFAPEAVTFTCVIASNTEDGKRMHRVLLR